MITIKQSEFARKNYEGLSPEYAAELKKRRDAYARALAKNRRKAMIAANDKKLKLGQNLLARKKLSSLFGLKKPGLTKEEKQKIRNSVDKPRIENTWKKGQFVQYLADNYEQDIRKLDKKAKKEAARNAFLNKISFGLLGKKSQEPKLEQPKLEPPKTEAKSKPVSNVPAVKETVEKSGRKKIFKNKNFLKKIGLGALGALGGTGLGVEKYIQTKKAKSLRNKKIAAGVALGSTALAGLGYYGKKNKIFSDLDYPSVKEISREQALNIFRNNPGYDLFLKNELHDGKNLRYLGLFDNKTKKCLGLLSFNPVYYNSDKYWKGYYRITDLQVPKSLGGHGYSKYLVNYLVKNIADSEHPSGITIIVDPFSKRYDDLIRLYTSYGFRLSDIPGRENVMVYKGDLKQKTYNALEHALVHGTEAIYDQEKKLESGNSQNKQPIRRIPPRSDNSMQQR